MTEPNDPLVVPKKTKKTLGRRKIEMKKIEKKTSLQVTFTKRRKGLFKKAAELSVLCGAEIAILVQSPAGKIFTFGHPSADAVIDHLQTAVAVSAPSSMMMPEKEEKSRVSHLWWEEPIEGMKLEELEKYMGALEGLRANVLERLGEMDKLKNVYPFPSTSSSAAFDFPNNLEDFNPIQIPDDEPRQILQKSLVMGEEGSAHDQAPSAITAVECRRTSCGYAERETHTSSNGFRI